MFHHTTWRAALLAGVLAVAMATGARADLVNITSDGAAYGYDTVTLNESQFSFPNGGSAAQVYSGADLISGTDLTTGTLGSWLVFCTDVHDYLQGTPYTFSEGSLADTVGDPTKVTQLAALISNGTMLLAGLNGGMYTDNGSAYSATNVSSALQIAVWTAEYQTGDGSYTPTDSTRGFWVSGASNAGDLKLAQTFLNDVTSGVWTLGSGHSVTQFESVNPQNNQDLSFDPTAVPEPATFALLAAGLLGLASARRRRA